MGTYTNFAGPNTPANKTKLARLGGNYSQGPFSAAGKAAEPEAYVQKMTEYRANLHLRRFGDASLGAAPAGIDARNELSYGPDDANKVVGNDTFPVGLNLRYTGDPNRVSAPKTGDNVQISAPAGNVAYTAAVGAPLNRFVPNLKAPGPQASNSPGNMSHAEVGGNSDPVAADLAGGLPATLPQLPGDTVQLQVKLGEPLSVL